MKKLKSKKTLIRKFGWKPDHLDARDMMYQVAGAPEAIATTANRTTAKMPDRFDQGQLGSCTANAWCGVVAYCLLNGHVQNKVKVSPLPFSRLFVYYNERVIENSVSQDSGAEIRDGIKTIANQGVCTEKSWKYDVNKFAKKPSPSCYKTALNFKALAYKRLDNTNLQQLVNCLQTGMPFVFGISVYSSFESAAVAKTGIVPMPDIKKEKLLGGHAIWAIDYDLEQKGFWCVNSWGNGWGVDGLFFLPEAYMTDPNLADDFWTLSTIL